jgi:hypothetical protein
MEPQALISKIPVVGDVSITNTEPALKGTLGFVFVKGTSAERLAFSFFYIT